MNSIIQIRSVLVTPWDPYSYWLKKILSVLIIQLKTRVITIQTQASPVNWKVLAMKNNKHESGIGGESKKTPHSENPYKLLNLKLTRVKKSAAGIPAVVAALSDFI